MAALDLGDVAQADPGLRGDVAQGHAAPRPLGAQHVAEQATEQHHADLLSVDVVRVSPNATRDLFLPAAGSQPTPTVPPCRSGPGSPTGRRPASSASAVSPSGAATPTYTVPGGFPSCSSGPATPVVLTPYVAPVSAAHPAGHRPGALRGDHAVPLDQPRVDAEHVDLRLGGVAHHPTEERRGRAGRLGEQHGQPAAGERLRHGHRLAALLQQPLGAVGLRVTSGMLAHTGAVRGPARRAGPLRRAWAHHVPCVLDLEHVASRAASFGSSAGPAVVIFFRTTLIVRVFAAGRVVALPR